MSYLWAPKGAIKKRSLSLVKLASAPEIRRERIANGELRAEQNGKLVQDIEKIKELTEKTLDDQLPNMARQALLVS